MKNESHCTIRLNSGETVPVPEGDSIFLSLRRAGIHLTASCGGKGTCGKCRVRILSGSCSDISHMPQSQKGDPSVVVLACRVFPQSDMLVDIPQESRLVVGDKISLANSRDLPALFASYGAPLRPGVRRIPLSLPHPTLDDNISDLERLRRALDEKGYTGMRFSRSFMADMAHTLRSSSWNIELICVREEETGREAISIFASDTCAGEYGIAVDIGTTTIAVYLVNLENGTVIDSGSTYNSQMRYGDDVITRIVQSTEGGMLEELRETVVSDISMIVSHFRTRHHIEDCSLASAVIAGNTTMAHLFWGLNPGPIREEPYIPTLNRFPLWDSASAGLPLNTRAPVYTVPCVASYVGGDIVAGVLASKMHRNPEIAFFMDIGTNGEIVIGNNEWLMTAACSAGPCFEGSGIHFGMRAIPGAIESVVFDPLTEDPVLAVIGGGKPLGICGSGMIDAISGMFLNGIIDRKGKFVSGKSARVQERTDDVCFLLYRDKELGKDIVLTETDIGNVIRAKAAMYAGVSTLLGEAGLSFEDLSVVYIAGGFGNYLNVEKAVILGMLPDIPRERFVFMGNASLTGAYLCLLSKELRREAEALAEKMTSVELSVTRRFMDEYLSALFLPHTDFALFPSVGRKFSS